MEGDDDIDSWPVDEGPLEYNQILKNNKLVFHEQTSSLKTKKGRPILDQVTPFDQIQDDPKWEIRSGPAFIGPRF